MFEVIRKERLDRFLDTLKELDVLYDRRAKIESKYGVHSLTLSKDKVKNGSKFKYTDQELYALEVSEISDEISSKEQYIKREKDVLIKQCKRLDYIHRLVILLYFVHQKKWSQITHHLFSIESDYEERYDVYRRKTFELRKQALTALQKTSEIPFIEYEQIHLEGL